MTKRLQGTKEKRRGPRKSRNDSGGASGFEKLEFEIRPEREKEGEARAREELKELVGCRIG